MPRFKHLEHHGSDPLNTTVQTLRTHRFRPLERHDSDAKDPSETVLKKGNPYKKNRIF
jgi:hypothetical protein